MEEAEEEQEVQEADEAMEAGNSHREEAGKHPVDLHPLERPRP